MSLVSFDAFAQTDKGLETVALDYVAPDACPNANDFQNAVRMRLGDEVFDADSADKLSVFVTEEDQNKPQFSGAIRWQRKGEEAVIREFEAEESCQTLIKSMALSFALAVDPFAALEGPKQENTLDVSVDEPEEKNTLESKPMDSREPNGESLRDFDIDNGNGDGFQQYEHVEVNGEDERFSLSVIGNGVLNTTGVLSLDLDLGIRLGVFWSDWLIRGGFYWMPLKPSKPIGTAGDDDASWNALSMSRYAFDINLCYGLGQQRIHVCANGRFGMISSEVKSNGFVTSDSGYWIEVGTGFEATVYRADWFRVLYDLNFDISVRSPSIEVDGTTLWSQFFAMRTGFGVEANW